MVQKVINIGNSLGITLPNDYVKEYKIKKGQKINFNLSLPTPPASYEFITDLELQESIKEVEAQYGPALDELAKLQ